MIFVEVILFTMAISSLGYLTLHKFFSLRDNGLMNALSFHAGFFIFTFLQLIALLWPSIENTYILLAIFCVGYALWLQKTWVKILKFIGIAVTFSLLAASVKALILTTDSYYFVLLSQSFRFPEIPKTEFGTFLNLWSPLGIVAFSSPRFWSLEVLYFLPLLSTFYFIFAFLTLVLKLYSHQGLKFICLLAGIILSTGQFLYHSIYLHNNFLSGHYLCLALTLVLLYRRFKQQHYISLFLFLISCFAMLRMESSLFTLAMMALVVPLFGDLLTFKNSKWVFVVTAIILSLWGFSIGFLVRGKSHLAGPAQFYFMGLLFMAFVMLLLSQKIVGYFFHKRVFTIFTFTCLLGHLGLLLFKGTHLLKSDQALLGTLFKEVYWGWSWIFIAGVLVTLAFCRNTQWSLAYQWALSVLGVFFIILLSLGAFRSPFHGGLGDSGNRILIHIFPFAVFIALEGFLQVLTPKFFGQESWSREKEAPSLKS